MYTVYIGVKLSEIRSLLICKLSPPSSSFALKPLEVLLHLIPIIKVLIILRTGLIPKDVLPTLLKHHVLPPSYVLQPP